MPLNNKIFTNEMVEILNYKELHRQVQQLQERFSMHENPPNQMDIVVVATLVVRIKSTLFLSTSEVQKTLG